MAQLTAWAYKVKIYPWKSSPPQVTIELLGKKPGEDQPRPLVGVIHFHADGGALPADALESGDGGGPVHVYHMPVSMFHTLHTALREEGPSLYLEPAADGAGPGCLCTNEEPIGESERK
jgi:hypothetical protein